MEDEDEEDEESTYYNENEEYSINYNNITNHNNNNNPASIPISPKSDSTRCCHYVLESFSVSVHTTLLICVFCSTEIGRWCEVYEPISATKMLVRKKFYPSLSKNAYALGKWYPKRCELSKDEMEMLR